MDINALKIYVGERLQESSTWRGLILIATSSGAVVVPPDMFDSVIALGIFASGCVAALTKDKVKGAENAD